MSNTGPIERLVSARSYNETFFRRRREEEEVQAEEEGGGHKGGAELHVPTSTRRRPPRSHHPKVPAKNFGRRDGPGGSIGSHERLTRWAKFFLKSC